MRSRRWFFGWPGSAAQTLDFDVFDARGRWGASLQRTVHNQIFFYRQIGSPDLHDLSMSAEGRAQRSFGALDLSGSLTLTHRWNRDFVRNEVDVGAQLTLAWWPGRSAPAGLAPSAPAPAAAPH